jgi:hypothetical protein
MVVIKQELNLEHRLALVNLISNTTAGSTAWSWSRRKWISGDSNCETFTVRETWRDCGSAPHCPHCRRAPRCDAATYR